MLARSHPQRWEVRAESLGFILAFALVIMAEPRNLSAAVLFRLVPACLGLPGSVQRDLRRGVMIEPHENGAFYARSEIDGSRW